jgi:prepilin-type N-terminal cleavage/methylation domain-containing protein
MRGRRARGFTLIELITSLLIFAVLAFGMASAVVVTVRAAPDGDDPASTVGAARTELTQLTDDLVAAVYMTEHGANAVTFTLADRDGDGLPEVVRYTWGGTKGDPLVRRYNGVDATVLEGVQQFELAYTTEHVDEQFPGPLVEGSEIELQSFDVPTGDTDIVIAPPLSLAQEIVPVLPADAASWSVTRALVHVRRAGSSGARGLVQLRAMDGELPLAGTETLREMELRESWLEWSYIWYEFDFDDLTGLDPADRICLALESQTDAAADVSVDSSGTGAFLTVDSDVTWTAQPYAMRHFVYGKVSAPSALRTFTREHVRAVRVALQADADPDSLVETTIETLNQPEVLSDVWELDFGADPTKFDFDADGVADWTTADGRPFPVDQLSGGVWSAAGTADLHTTENAFNEPITCEVRMRDTTDDGRDGSFKVRLEGDGSRLAKIDFDLERVGDSQTLVMRSTNDAGALEVRHSVEGLGLGMVDLRVLAGTSANLFHVEVNGTDVGTFYYETAPSPFKRVIRLDVGDDTDTGMQFEYVRIRHGGSAR